MEINDATISNLVAEAVNKRVDDWFNRNPNSIRQSMDRATEKVVIMMTEKSNEAYNGKMAEKKIEEVSKELESKHFDELKERICSQITKDFAELLNERFFDKYY